MDTQVIVKPFHKQVISRTARLEKYHHFAVNQKLDFVFTHFPEYKEVDQSLLIRDLRFLWPNSFERTY